jgi:preprotein translocase subunit SecB
MAENATGPVYELEKIYLKDASFESPSSPGVFTRKDYKPKIDVDMSVEVSGIGDDPAAPYYEVVLHCEVRAESDDSTAFLVSVQQAGIFRVAGFNDEQLPLMLHVASPNSLLPFLRESVSDLVTKGGFPQVLLSPVNFEALYRRRLQEQATDTAH